MRASFSESGDLVLRPETNLERMAAKAFVQSMRHRDKPQILIEPALVVLGVDMATGPELTACSHPPKASVSLIAQEDEPGQQALIDGQVIGHVTLNTPGLTSEQVARAVGGI